MDSTYWNSTLNVYQFDVDAFNDLSYGEFRPTFCSAWLGAMMATGFAYFFLSSNRKSNLFKLQLFCVFLAILHNTSEMAFEIFFHNAMFSRSGKGMNWIISSIWLSFGLSLDHLIPLFADFTLLFRISAFYPYPVYSKRVRLYIFTPFVLFNVLRLILCILIFISAACENLINPIWISGSTYPDSGSPYWFYLAQDYLIITELIMGSIFCFIASSILLFKAYKLSKSSISSTRNQQNVKRRMQFFIEALLMCFIPPFLLNVSAVVQVMLNVPQYTYFKEVQTCNVNVSVIFSILANAWPKIRDEFTKKHGQEDTKAIINQTRRNVN